MKSGEVRSANRPNPTIPYTCACRIVDERAELQYRIRNTAVLRHRTARLHIDRVLMVRSIIPVVDSMIIGPLLYTLYLLFVWLWDAGRCALGPKHQHEYISVIATGTVPRNYQSDSSIYPVYELFLALIESEPTVQKNHAVVLYTV